MPNELIGIFRVGQQAIVGTIDEIYSVLRSYSEAKPKIRVLQQKLLAHFSRQDEDLFNELNSFYKSDRHAMKMIEFLMYNLKDIKVKFLTFFDKHSGEMDDINYRTFPRDFSEFAKEIMAYLKIEEEYLFPLLGKLPS